MAITTRNPHDAEREVEAAQAGQEGPVLTEIDHVAIAVRDLGEAIDAYREAFDTVVEHREVLDDDDVEVAHLRVAQSYVQLLAPTGDDSPLADFLDARGEGLHHVGYRVADCAAALAHLRAQGHRLVDERPRRGSRGTLVAFVHPHALHGTLIALVQDG